jgi:hypothetical protein
VGCAGKARLAHEITFGIFLQPVGSVLTGPFFLPMVCCRRFQIASHVLAGGRIGFDSRTSDLQRIHQYRAVLQNAGASVIMEKTAH